MSVTRVKEIQRRRRRRQKLALLRQRYRQAKTQAEKQKILEKAVKVAPTAKLE